MRLQQAFFRTVVLFLVANVAARAEPVIESGTERTQGFVSVGEGVRLYYVEEGSGPDVLVAPLAFYLESHLLHALSKNRRVIFYDPRNRGRSDRAELSSVSLDQQIEDLEALRIELKLTKMALLGWSSSGMEMAAYTIRYPEHVSRLIQISPIAPAASILEQLGDTRAQPDDRLAIDALDRRAEAGEFAEAAEKYCRLKNAVTIPMNFANIDFVDRVVDVCEYQNEWPVHLTPYFGAFFATFGEYDWREELHDLKVPRLIIHGREDGIPLAGARAWVTGYSNARLVVLSPSGHLPYIEQNTAVIAAINTFLGGTWPENAIAIPDFDIDALTADADAGDPNAQFSLANAYDTGYGVRPNGRKAMQHYLLAAEQGHANAQNSVGSGLQAVGMYAEALIWYQRAAEQGHALATNNLAYLYDLGLGVTQDKQRGFELYSRSAKSGRADAMWNIANMYGIGELGEIDLHSACVWTARARKYAGSGDHELLGPISDAEAHLEDSLSADDLAQCDKEAADWAPAE